MGDSADAPKVSELDFGWGRQVRIDINEKSELLLGESSECAGHAATTHQTEFKRT